MSRDVPTLFNLILRNVEKFPSTYIRLDYVRKALEFQQKLPNKGEFLDVIQLLIDHIIKAGRMTDDIFAIESFQKNRTSIVLKNSKVTGKYVSSLAEWCPSLITIDVSGCLQVDDDCIDTICKSCKSLQNLLIQNCRKITDDTFSVLIRSSLAQLRAVDVGGNFNITSKGVLTFINNYKYFERIKSLNFSGLILDDSILHALCMSKTCSIEQIGLGYGDFSEHSLTEFLRQCGATLTSLNISWLSTTPSAIHTQISGDVLLEDLIRFCPRLSILDISGLKSVTSNHIQTYIDQRIQKVNEIFS